jgi:hypothetical protein
MEADPGVVMPERARSASAARSRGISHRNYRLTFSLAMHLGALLSLFRLFEARFLFAIGLMGRYCEEP